MPTTEMLKKAIENHTPIRFRYTAPGRVDGIRIGNPHVLYVTSTDNVLCDTWQTDGASSDTENVPGWRCFKVGDVEIEALLDSEPEFTPESTFNPSNKRFKQWISIVEVKT